MRRKRMSRFHPVSRRSGVSASVMQMKRSVQTPVSSVRSLSGFALRLPVSAAQTSHPNGPSDARNTTGLSPTRIVRSESLTRQVLVVPLQVHPAVEAGHLIAVAVEQQGLAHEEVADAALLSLAPARMVHRRLHVCVEAVLVRRAFQ